ncbi:hypothetical protein BDM02DRAFT_3184398 [Thelephora ganbajun]|uniref:Uncharacterized protein n=1 Tax=Thelephora ganbajun TaxID=370292 RepID=A0ACB6ZQ65_THEGA|nr:hypothetical protein BDM02DRAFT_3184398 [Thelephora ganbajun]
MSFYKSLDAIVDPSSVDEIGRIGKDLSAIHSTILVGFAGFTVLIYDHLITFADEIEYIWQTFKGPFVYLFLINRYLIPLGFIVNLYAYLSDWNYEDKFDPGRGCARYVRYEGSMTVIGINIVGLMMLLRIRALYNKNSTVVLPVAALLALEFGINAWLLSHGIPVQHTGPRYPCTMVFEAKLTKIAAASAWLPLLYDTVVMALTIYKAFQARSLPGHFRSPILQTVLAGGMIYYSSLQGIHGGLYPAVHALPTFSLTVAMMSRITIDLKKRAQEHIYYNLPRHAVVGNEDGPYCYQLSHIRFRDIITGWKSTPRNIRMPHRSAWKWSLGNLDMVSIAREVTVDEISEPIRDQDGDPGSPPYTSRTPSSFRSGLT